MWFALQVWNWVMEPLLFATIGTSIVFKELPAETIPKSLLVVCTGDYLGSPTLRPLLAGSGACCSVLRQLVSAGRLIVAL